ncbi:sulfurtransferase [Hydrogenophilus thermoluteolus]|uniref:sulfurtransferase n=1 Tax=Hydrogenophilus thermoluteolus TaxID=297 RepID=UPI0024A0E005|nr:rhodanese-like domain-containing protein [Hydrogenophilus thermoluteolus]GLW60435.1 sulfurtransferase [Hydrogenophilus thermoluteolus]
MRVRFVLAGLLITGTVSAAELPGPVVTVDWLAQNLDRVQVVQVHAPDLFTAQPQYKKDEKSGQTKLVDVGGHIPGALFVNPKKMRTERQIGDLKVKYLLPPAAEFTQFVQANGIQAGKPIVLVPTGTSPAEFNDAARLYWQFKYYGEKDIAILDGGLAAWIQAGQQVESTPVKIQPGNWQPQGENPSILATSEDVAAGKAQLVDARPISMAFGYTKRDYVYDYGHIAGAKVFPPELHTIQKGIAHHLLSADTYAKVFQAMGIDPKAPSITYCNSGHLSSGPWFILHEVMGNPNVKLYDGSLHQWTLEKRPLVSLIPHGSR